MNAIPNPASPHLIKPAKTLVIVGMPGAGKSSIGRRLASRLGWAFIDSDQEVEAAAGMKISQIFETLGEQAFRQGERQVIARLLERSPHVLATGGGAFMSEETRALIRDRALSIWLKAELPVLLERTSRRDDRPLLKKNAPKTVLQELLAVREPIYATADIVVTSDPRPVDETVDKVLTALDEFLNKERD
ncbi:MAG: shikimate kinase [Alphaproteobacteria bacterium]|nr:shikimate kinase [Alphaproteobacteria bacterium]